MRRKTQVLKSIHPGIVTKWK